MTDASARRPSHRPVPAQPAKNAEREEHGHDEHGANILGMWIFLATEVLFFGALFTAYIVYRSLYPEAFGQASSQLDIVLGTINTAILLTSSLTMALAVNAAQTGSRRVMVLLMVITMLLGTVFLGIKGLEYVHKFEENLFPGANFIFPGANAPQARLFFSLYFTMTGLHALHMIIGILVLGVFAVRGWLGHFTSGHWVPVEMFGLYWHFVDIVWIFLFPLLYLVHRT